ncbi:twin-arginine translocation signal domain-containing protein [Helicobacter sp. MIT 14-3879]|uniref:twin-arginine translocation signal domain-containing protein n=1 Tax=Helicobacter sp. MIT 14-3879 TaxID=2040649 RepID=UPI0015F1A5C2|nr:twin-arginine translocation signal domain-containing protein [Helicobacter sp. MIT 14-3879]
MQHQHTNLENVEFHTKSGLLKVNKRDSIYSMDFPSFPLRPVEVDFNRRDFLKTSATLGVTIGTLGIGGISPLLADSQTSGVSMQTLNNGVQIPIIGLGTYGLRGKECQRSVLDALSVGYRLFD